MIVRLKLRQVEAMIQRHLSNLLTEEQVALPWRIVRMGPRGVEIAPVDEESIERAAERTRNRLIRRLER